MSLGGMIAGNILTQVGGAITQRVGERYRRKWEEKLLKTRHGYAVNLAKRRETFEGKHRDADRSLREKQGKEANEISRARLDQETAYYEGRVAREEAQAARDQGRLAIAVEEFHDRMDERNDPLARREREAAVTKLEADAETSKTRSEAAKHALKVSREQQERLKEAADNVAGRIPGLTAYDPSTLKTWRDMIADDGAMLLQNGEPDGQRIDANLAFLLENGVLAQQELATPESMFDGMFGTGPQGGPELRTPYEVVQDFEFLRVGLHRLIPRNMVPGLVGPYDKGLNGQEFRFPVVWDQDRVDAHNEAAQKYREKHPEFKGWTETYQRYFNRAIANQEKPLTVAEWMKSRVGPIEDAPEDFWKAYYVESVPIYESRYGRDDLEG